MLFTCYLNTVIRRDSYQFSIDTCWYGHKQRLLESVESRLVRRKWPPTMPVVSHKEDHVSGPHGHRLRISHKREVVRRGPDCRARVQVSPIQV